MPEPDLCTVKEAAAILRIRRATLKKILAGGMPEYPVLPYVELEGMKMIRREALSSWIVACEKRESEVV